MTLPPLLEGITVVDFSQFLSGPYCSLRLLDFGARVIKIENPDGGDLTRRLYLSDTQMGEDSTLFHAINRGKESVTLDLKVPTDHTTAMALIADADIVIQNFRPEVMERLGLDYETAKTLNPKLIYGSISGYGADGPWANLPGQDLLAQAKSGVMWLSGNAGQGPVPIGLPIADMLAGANLAHGILAALYRREKHGLGAHIETSLLEALVDLQFEFLTTYLNNGERPPERITKGSAHGYLPAPYGLFEMTDGHLALAMNDLRWLAETLDLPEIIALCDQHGAAVGFKAKDAINHILARKFASQETEAIESLLTSKGLWCAKVLS